MISFENPTIAAFLGAVGGALVSALVSLFIWKKTHKVKQVDCIINEKRSLLSISDTIKDKLEIRVSGKPAKTAYLISLEVINSGTEAVFNQPVLIHLSEGAQIVDYNIKTEPAKGFGEIQQKHYGNCLDLMIALMDINNVVKIEILSIDNSSDDIEVYLKNANVRTRVYPRQSAEKIFRSVITSSSPLIRALLTVLPGMGGMVNLLTMIELNRKLDKVSNITMKD